MTGGDLAQIITSASTLIGVLWGIRVSSLNTRKIGEVHEAVDGKMDKLVTEVRAASFAKGVKAEKENVSSTPTYDHHTGE
jgi:hypothetical protein